MNLDLLLTEANTIVICGHINPDGDCIGSCLATYNYIKKYYSDKIVDIYLDPIPNIFKFLKYSNEIKSDRSRDRSYDLFISQDCGDLGRLGDAVKYFKQAKVTVNIDHHISNPCFGDYNYVFPDASSASELVFQLLPKERIDKAIAECIYTGIVHDTGVFQYAATSRSTMEAAGFLMECGIDYSGIVNDTYFSKTFEQNKIIGTALLKSELHLNGVCISSIITKKDMEICGVLPKHLDGIAAQLRATKGVETAIFLYEINNGEYKVSLRSEKVVDVAEIAARHGGGGHKRAAGCTIIGNPEEIVSLLIKEIADNFEWIS